MKTNEVLKQETKESIDIQKHAATSHNERGKQQNTEQMLQLTGKNFVGGIGLGLKGFGIHFS